MRYLFILNDPPYGTERTYNGFRLALSLAGVEGTEVSVFLMGDAVGSGVAGQKTPNGYYNLERLLKGLAGKGAKRSSMEELTSWTTEADRVLVF